MTPYEKQANDFLKKTETTLEVKEATPQTPPQWAQGEKDAHKHIKYTCTLKNKHHTYTFPFWGSIHDWEEKNNAIEVFTSVLENKNRIVLNCLASIYGLKIDNQALNKLSQYVIKKDILILKTIINEQLTKKYTPTAYDILASMYPLYEDTFEDFCYSFGYDTDSIKARDTYQACMQQENNLRKLFNREEIALLTDIN